MGDHEDARRAGVLGRGEGGKAQVEASRQVGPDLPQRPVHLEIIVEQPFRRLGRFRWRVDAGAPHAAQPVVGLGEAGPGRHLLRRAGGQKVACGEILGFRLEATAALRRIVH